jgi:8-oxo-dGTP pyrophosphatase MutT (NUDIX family)
MHIGRHIIQELVMQFGQPAVERWSIPMLEQEFSELKDQMALGRAHDVTSLIVRGDEVAVIRKPQYPPEAFRTPSGGIHPEESFLDGAIRETKEETGLDVAIEAYLLYVLPTFTYGEESAKWVTHVLLARPVAGELVPLDKGEIAEARWVGWEPLLETINPILRGTGLGGLEYRARLHERMHELVTARKERQPENE